MKITNTLYKTTLISITLLLGQAQAAAPFNPEAQPLGYIGPLELSTTDLSTNGARAYRGWFENGSWQGDLIEYTVEKNGALSTSITFGQNSPEQGGTENWSAHVQFESKGANYWDDTRKIITFNNADDEQVAFRWDTISDSQRLAIDATAANDATSDILDFLRGDSSNEKPGGNLRNRYSMLGDIVHTNPAYLGAPAESFSDSSYVAYQNKESTRPARVYVGANDGMLHAFNAITGDEVWAYIPSMLVPKLSRLAGASYAHTYFVDGGINIRDAEFNNAWHSVLIGSLGAGGKGLYALDVSDENLSDETSNTGTDKKILWELSENDDDDVGYIFDRTRIVKLNDGKWYAANGNGVSSVNGVAKLLLVEIGSGTVRELDTASGSKTLPNGLAAPAMVDTDGDGKVDIAYAGDINGDLWKFDLTSADATKWGVAYQLYQGKGTQPITMAPDVTRHPQYGYLVLFGTGRLYTNEDIKDKSIQALYGIWDTESKPSLTENRLQRVLSDDTGFPGGSEDVRTFTTTQPINYLDKKGWYVELEPGERVLTPPQLRAGRMKATITDPDGFRNLLVEVTFDEGSAEEDAIYDLTFDGVLNEDDLFDANIDGDLLDLEDVPMAWRRDNGNMSQVTIARLGDGKDTLFLNFLNPPLVSEACSGNCAGGLAGGHMDIDVNYSLGADTFDTDSHDHEYDKKCQCTFVDYFVGKGQTSPDSDKEIKMEPIDNDATDLDPDEKFIMIVANADLSPGAVIILNNKAYGVVEYQRMIHKALAKWNGNPNTLKDPDGTSLVHSIKALNAAYANDPDTIRMQLVFDTRVLVSGGLHPTQTGCVNGNKDETPQNFNGRIRNGALTWQWVKASHFAGLGTESALDRLTVLNPADLKNPVVLTNGTPVELAEDTDNTPGINPAKPAYEVYGGLDIDDDDAFFLEGTAFWHFKDVTIRNPDAQSVSVCYGDPLWELAYESATVGLTPELFQDMLNKAGVTSVDEIPALLEDAKDCAGNKKLDKKVREACKARVSVLEDLLDMSKEVNYPGGGDGDGSGEGSGTSIAGDPQTITSQKADNLGISKGLNTNLGRRTWIDIMPE